MRKKLAIGNRQISAKIDGKKIICVPRQPSKCAVFCGGLWLNRRKSGEEVRAEGYYSFTASQRLKIKSVKQNSGRWKAASIGILHYSDRQKYYSDAVDIVPVIGYAIV